MVRIPLDMRKKIQKQNNENKIKIWEKKVWKVNQSIIDTLAIANVVIHYPKRY